MLASKHDIRVAAKERHPSAVNIRLEAKEDFKIPGVVEVDGEHPGIRVIVNADGRQYVYEADTRDELLLKLLEKRDETDEIRPAELSTEWGPESILKILQRQIRELEAERVKIRALHNSDPTTKGKPLSAGDKPALLQVVLELQSLRKLAADIEGDIKGDTA
jgi:hypothetical protein